MPTGGAYISAFTDFMQTTGPLTLTSAASFVNEAALRNYTLSRFLDGFDMTEKLKGGTKIQDFIIRTDASTFTFYKPNAQFSWANPQVMTSWEIPWRFGIDYMTWTEQEVLLQGGDMDRMTQEALFDVFKSVQRKVEARMWTSMMNGIEAALWEEPDKTVMEAADGERPYSIPAFVNEAANGLYTDGSVTWTTVQQLDPTTETYWVPVRLTYDYDDYRDTNNQGDGLILGFEKMVHKLSYKLPPMGSKFFATEQRRMFCATGLGGILIYKDALRKSNDRGYVSNPQDPAYLRPLFAGFDVEEFETLENAALYLTGTPGTQANYAAATVNGPRYYFVNTNYLRMIFHNQNYFERRNVREPTDQVGSYTQPTTTWYNLCCRSRRRGLGILYPAA